MSLFKEPFDPSIKAQLDARQRLMGKPSKSSQDIVYLNGKTAWIQLRSSVDIIGAGANNPKGLASDNVLMGGTLTASNTMKSGIGNSQTSAYSYRSYNKSYGDLGYDFNVLGTRPMPGITDISIQNKGAYGSLRQATVNFQCWDIKQLDLMEQLYMRPGYTVLLEWGWRPYINNSGDLEKTLYQDNGFFGRKNIDLQLYLNQLRQLSIASQGNYDAMFGYVMNYSWKYRSDGGYDCSTEIISTGEILESYKINFSGAPAYLNGDAGMLLSANEYEDIDLIREDYGKNVLTGLVTEAYALVKSTDTVDDGVGQTKYDYNGKTGLIDYAIKTIDLDISSDFFSSSDDTVNEKGPGGGNKAKGSILDNDKNIYITLESFVGLMNNFILLENPEADGKKSLVKLSVNDREDVGKNDQPLKCLYHPLQFSVDPRVCVLKNPQFAASIAGISVSSGSSAAVDVKTIPSIPPTTQASNIFNQIKKIKDGQLSGDDTISKLLKNIKTKEELISLADYYVANVGNKNGNPKTFFEYLDKDTKSGIGTNGLTEYFEGGIYDSLKHLGDDIAIRHAINLTKEERANNSLEKEKRKTEVEAKKIEKAKEDILDNSEGSDTYVGFCNSLTQAYNPGDGTPYGIHSNIYINLRLLYNLSIDDSVKGQDPAEKQAISLMTYMKNLLTLIQNSTGNVNNFEIIIDGQTGYITDVNATPGEKIEPFVFNIGSNNSIIRDISMESQIFSDQSTIIAVAAQSDAGKLGLENSSMVAFNNNIEDRMIKKKDAPISSNKSQTDQLVAFGKNLVNLTTLFDSMSGDSELNVDQIDGYKTALNDIIVFYTSLYKSNNKYKAILPTKISLTMDGIGGMIIGNIFNIDKTFTPRSYKGDGTGVELYYTVTNLKHQVSSNNQWTTTIEGNPFIPDSSFDTLTAGQEGFYLKLNLEINYKYNPSTGQVESTFAPAIDPNPTNFSSKAVPGNLKIFRDELSRVGFNETMITAILAKTMTESGGYKFREAVNYSKTSNERIRKIFGKRMTPYSEDQLTQLKSNIPAFVDVIYGKDSGVGLGNTQIGDGYRYVGRGYIGITGRAIYQKYKDITGIDIISKPELLEQAGPSAKVCAAYMKDRVKFFANKYRYSENETNQLKANELVLNAIAGNIKRDLTSGHFKDIFAAVNAHSRDPKIIKIAQGKA
jgi:hypothetical protein